MLFFNPIDKYIRTYVNQMFNEHRLLKTNYQCFLCLKQYSNCKTKTTIQAFLPKQLSFFTCFKRAIKIPWLCLSLVIKSTFST